MADLSPLWMERLTLLDDFEQWGIGRMPSWDQIERESADYRRRIESGEIEWPPTASPLAPMFARMGRWDTAPPQFDPRCVLCFVHLPSIAAILRRLDELARRTPAGLIDNLIDTTAHELFHLAMWRHYGKRVYLLGRRTLDLLAETDLPDVPAEHLRAPLSSFYLRLPEGAYHFDVEQDPEPQPAEGVFVAFDQAEAEPGRPRELSLLFTGRSRHGTEDDNVAYVSALIGPDTPISDITLPGADRAVRSVGGRALGETIPRVILGLCLYLQSEHPELEAVPPPARKDPALARSTKKRRKIEQQNARTSALGYIRVGREAAGPANETRRGEGSGRALDHQVWVRGHWRHQPYGPGRTLRRWRWIRPHLRGPDLAESERIRAARIQPARRRRD